MTHESKSRIVCDHFPLPLDFKVALFRRPCTSRKQSLSMLSYAFFLSEATINVCMLTVTPSPFGMHQHRCITMQRRHYKTSTNNVASAVFFFRLLLLENFARPPPPPSRDFASLTEAHNFANNNSDRTEVSRMTGSRFRVVDNKRLIVKFVRNQSCVCRA